MENEKIFGAYFTFEPDLYFPETPKGLSYYAYRSGDKILLDVLNDYEVYSQGDYYTGARDSKSTYVTEPYPYELSSGDTVYLITLSTPVTDSRGRFLGVANCDILADSINSIDFNEGGYDTAHSTILTSQGMYVADSADNSKLGTLLDTGSKDGERIYQAVQNGEPLLFDGHNDHFGGKKAIVSYIPITLEGTNLRWASGFIVNKSEVFAGQNTMTAVIILTCVAGVLLLSVCTSRIIKRSLSPISYVMGLADRMRRCDLTEIQTRTDLPNDELGQLADIFTEVSEDLTAIIKDINRCLNSMAAGNFRVDSQREEKYVGGCQYILKDMRAISHKLSQTLMQIEQTSEHVQSGSEQVAVGAQTLSQVSTEQAASVERIAQGLDQISSVVQNNSTTAEESAAASEELSSQANIMKSMMTKFTLRDDVQDMDSPF